MCERAKLRKEGRVGLESQKLLKGEEKGWVGCRTRLAFPGSYLPEREKERERERREDKGRRGGICQTRLLGQGLWPGR